MALFRTTYGDPPPNPYSSELVGASPYISDVQVMPHGIAAASPGYGGAPSDETADLISGVGSAATGVVNAYGAKKRQDADAAWRDRVLSLLSGPSTVPNAPAAGVQQNSFSAQAFPPAGTGTVSAPIEVPAVAQTPSTPTGASAMKLDAGPIPPTPQAPQQASSANSGGTLAMLLGLLGQKNATATTPAAGGTTSASYGSLAGAPAGTY